MESLGMVQEAKVVVALDFGTTFSGFAYALRADPENVYTYYDWPKQAEGGGLPYCKTQTSLLYSVHLNDVELCAWGWPAYVEYCKSKDFAQSMDTLSLSGDKHFLTLFKLHLAGKELDAPALPRGMTARRVITDYLSQISVLILEEVRNKFGAHVTLEDVQWCLTVPAIWNEQAKREMKICAELAGLVQGPQSESGSPHVVKLFIEPEAASVYSQQKLRDRAWRKGDKFLVVDCGGGTVDLVLHEKLGSAATLSVREVQESSGDDCGGSRVDEEFFSFLRKKIACFLRFEREHPSIAMAFRQDWEKIKYDFDGAYASGGVSLELPPKLATLWEKEDVAKGRSSLTSSSESYDELILTNHDMRSIFDPVVNRILKLILERMAPDLHAIMVVGGFSASPYLMSRIRDMFGSTVAAIVSPPYPGSAVCCGAVTMGIRSDTIVSRVAKKTYGVRMSVPFQPGVHPEEFKIFNDCGRAYCANIFDIFVRKGDEVRVNDRVKHSIFPIWANQEDMLIELYASEKRIPKYVVGDSESKKDGAVTISFPSYRELGFWPEVEVSMFFGRTEIQVTAIGANFNSEEKKILPVKFERDSIY